MLRKSSTEDITKDKRDSYDFHTNIFKQYCSKEFTLRFLQKEDYDKGN